MKGMADTIHDQAPSLESLYSALRVAPAEKRWLRLFVVL